jgi:hypothetical protein
LTKNTQTRRRGFATAAGVTVGALAFLLTLVDFSTRFTRTANSLGYASNFFDFQGRAFLDGRLAVPDGSLGIEGFLDDGREYMYFGPWPALLRMPILSTTTEYDGRLTVVSMALAFVLFAVMTTRLTWLVRDLMHPDEPVTRFECAAMAIFLALATGGTTLTYVAALPWVYHEVYAWVIAFVTGSMYWMLRLLRDPRPSAALWLLAFNLGAVLTRTTGGWAVCLVSLAIGIWFLAVRAGPRLRRVGLLALAAAVLPFVCGVVVNWLKFQHLFFFPLEDQVWTELNEHRQQALEINGGSITGLQFLPTALMAYLRLDGVRFVDYFPFITLPAESARAYGNAFIDQSYRTGSVTAFMPLLFVLAIVALFVLFRPGADQQRRWLRFPLVAGVLVPGGVMVYGYFSHRYTAEFVPGLVFGGAVGAVAATHWLQRRRRWLGGAGLVAAAALTGYSIAAHMLIGHSAAVFTAGGPELSRYLALQHELSPQRQGELVTVSDDLPAGGSTDDLWIQGDCDSLWVNSGDSYERWVLVERRSLVTTATVSEDVSQSRIALIDVDTEPRRSVWLRLNSFGQARVELENEGGTHHGPWFDLLEPRQVRVGVRDLPQYGYAEVSANPGGFRGLMRSFQWENWVSRPTRFAVVPHTRRELARAGLQLTTERGLTPPVCDRIRESVSASSGRDNE